MKEGGKRRAGRRGDKTRQAGRQEDGWKEGKKE